MAEIVSIHGGTGDPNAPVKSVIDLCEALLADAKSGRLRALACGEVLGENEVQHSYAYGSYSMFALAAAIMLLQHRFCAKQFKDDEPNARS